jgi:hypothetical protein
MSKHTKTARTMHIRADRTVRKAHGFNDIAQLVTITP